MPKPKTTEANPVLDHEARLARVTERIERLTWRFKARARAEHAITKGQQNRYRPVQGRLFGDET